MKPGLSPSREASGRRGDKDCSDASEKPGVASVSRCCSNLGTGKHAVLEGLVAPAVVKRSEPWCNWSEVQVCALESATTENLVHEWRRAGKMCAICQNHRNSPLQLQEFQIFSTYRLSWISGGNRSWGGMSGSFGGNSATSKLASRSKLERGKCFAATKT